MEEELNVLVIDYRSNDDRVGAHCMHYIFMIVLAHFKNFPIYIDKSKKIYVDNIFMSSLYDYCDKYNSKYDDKFMNAKKVNFIYINDLLKINSFREKFCNLTYLYRIVETVNSDIYTYYKSQIMDDVLYIFNKKLNILNNVNFIKPSKDALIVHLRLDDCHYTTYDYNANDIVEFFNEHIDKLPTKNILEVRFKNYSRINQTEIYKTYKYINNVKQKMQYIRNNINEMSVESIQMYLETNIGSNWKQILLFDETVDIPLKDFILKYTYMDLNEDNIVNYNNAPTFLLPLQSIISNSRLEKLIKNINNNNVEIVALIDNSNNIQYINESLPYKIISNSCEEDLYYLSNSINLILSRSTFALTALFFNKDIENVWIPNWGISLALGLNTKYDKTSFNYF